MVIAMPTTHSPEPVITSGGESSATENENDLKNQCNPATGATVKDNRNKRKEKKSGLSLGSLKSPFKFLGKTYCRGCRKKCSGEVLRVNDVYFHNQCFRCKGCEVNLSQGGFFTRDKEYYCASCYQSNFGTKCNKCGQYVEGEVVTALGKTYHQNCFRCAGCQNPFPTGERVTFTGKSCLCQSCAAKDNLVSSTSPATKNGNAKASTSLEMIRNGSTVSASTTDGPSRTTTNGNAKQPSNATTTSVSTGKLTLDEGKCAGCNAELKDGQALMALDKHYHVWCFKCKSCDALLHGEYMGKDGQPYCEKCYQALFGVKCTYCFRFISGKVLQAGDNNHFHPTCARCTKCGEPFGDGEEMFLQGAAIWHPRCGPSPEDSGIVVNGGNFDGSIGGASPYPVRGGIGYHHSDVDGASTASELPPHHKTMHTSYGPYSSRASSPGGTLRHHGGDPMHWRSTSHMAGQSGGNFFMPSLYNSSSTYSLRRPIEAGDRSGSSSHLPHFHLPPSRRSSSSAGDRAGIPPPMSRLSRPGSQMSEVPTGGGFRPVSAPPKPGYTHASGKASTLPAGSNLSAASPGTPSGRMNGSSHNHYDVLSQSRASSRTDFSSDFMRSSNTYTHGFKSGGMRAATPLSGGTVMTEHKIYPVHLLFTSNYKLPPDIDRCNLEKHLSDSDFEMVFNMSRDDFYAMPLWRRNDYKRRVRLF